MIQRIQTAYLLVAGALIASLYNLKFADIAVNGELADAPQKINEGAYDAWMFRLRPSAEGELDTLLDADGYARLVETDPQ